MNKVIVLWLVAPFVLVFLSFESYMLLYEIDRAGGSTYESMRFQFILFELLPLSTLLVLIYYGVHKKYRKFKWRYLMPMLLVLLTIYIVVRIEYIGIY